MQIWDSVDGTVAWEGINEVTYTEDAGSNRVVTFSAVVERAAHDLVLRLP
ncbi:MAG: hypothetical protein ACREUQ_10970 [Burkholderiales bacterium]